MYNIKVLRHQNIVTGVAIIITEMLTPVYLPANDDSDVEEKFESSRIYLTQTDSVYNIEGRKFFIEPTFAILATNL